LLSEFGDEGNNTIITSRDAAGRILVNGGAVPVAGGTPTVANTSLIQVFGQGGNDVIWLDEANGALPAANLFGGDGNDTLTGGSGNDQLFGQAGNDLMIFAQRVPGRRHSRPAAGPSQPAAGRTGESSEPKSQELNYSARVSLDRTQMQIDDRMVNLSPGMAVTVEIKTGSRTILSYLLSPLLRYRQEILRER